MELFGKDLAELAGDGRMLTWLGTLIPQMEEWLAARPHGNFSRWHALLEKIQELPGGELRPGARIEVGSAEDITPEQQKFLRSALKQVQPWRKGPYSLFGVDIDSEWQSDLKWDRLKDHIADLTGRNVLDVGCGNGYHMWRMKEAGAERICGIDPFCNYLFQFLMIRALVREISGIHLFPLVLEQMPPSLESFDTVFSMGVIYHQKSPVDHLERLRDLLRPGGQLVLETLVVTGDEHTVLTPPDRYACMTNVWFIPSPEAALRWLDRTGFHHPRMISLEKTTSREQHRSPWGCAESLEDFLDPRDPGRTVEGHEAPQRAVFLAEKP